jgi:heat shock protein HtpX
MNYMRTAILLAGLTGLFMAVGYLLAGGSNAFIALIIAVATNLFSYWNAGKIVLSMHGAQEVDEHSAPELVAIVRELAQHAVCATAGLLNTLSRAEVAGVIRHELAHVRNRDTLTITATVAAPFQCSLNSACSLEGLAAIATIIIAVSVSSARSYAHPFHSHHYLHF